MSNKKKIKQLNKDLKSALHLIATLREEVNQLKASSLKGLTESLKRPQVFGVTGSVGPLTPVGATGPCGPLYAGVSGGIGPKDDSKKVIETDLEMIEFPNYDDVPETIFDGRGRKLYFD